MANSLLNLLIKAIAYNDLPSTSNPRRRNFDWTRDLQGFAVLNPKQNTFAIPANSTLSIFSGTRSTSIDNTTQFTLAVSILSSSRYRFTATSGTLPAFRTDRGLTPNTKTFTWTANVNGTSSLSSSTVGDFAAVLVGDTVFAPGPITGDGASPFSVLNQGLWTVIGKDGPSTVLQLQRLTGQAYSGATEAILATANTQLQAFSAAGVQVGDSVDISAGFSLPVLQSYVIQAVTPTWFEVISTGPLPIAQVATPTTAGITFYSAAKRLVYVEVDQEAAIQANGDTGATQRMSPIAAGDPENPGTYLKMGLCWSLTVVNRAAVPLNVTVLTAE